MQLNSLSWLPHRPSILLKFTNTTILLDCVLGMESLASFLPCPTVASCRFSWLKKVRPFRKGAIQSLKEISDAAFVDLIPEVQPLSLANVDIASIDVVLVSSLASLVALPFITEKAEFRGMVYATDPIVQFGRLVMEEFLDMFERIDRPPSDDSWKSICRSFSNPPSTDPFEWSPLYSREQMESSLAKVNTIYFQQQISINGELQVSAHSSGYSIGACNWLIQTEMEKIGYIASTSVRSSHSRPVSWDQFRGLDSLIMTSLSCSPDKPFEGMLQRFSSEVASTLRKGGNVLLPVAPTGNIYDLFEHVLRSIESHGLSQEIPVYFISVVADSALQFANIYSEWLSDEKGSKVNTPEEPFIHSELVRSRRIRVYDNIFGQFSREFRSPCVMFTGHPSLRVGDVVHFLDLWGADSRSAIIVTDPDYPLEKFYSPYKTLAIRAYYFPIETRLDIAQASSAVTDLSPRRLLIPDVYASKLSVAKVQHQMPFQKGQVLSIDDAQIRRKRVHVDSEIIQKLEVSSHNQSKDVGICALKGLLSAYDNDLQIHPVEKKRPKMAKNSTSSEDPETAVSQRFSGQMPRRLAGPLTADGLIRAFAEKKIKAEVDKSSNASSAEAIVIRIPAYSAQVTLSADGTRSKVSCPTLNHRKSIQTVISSCLVEL